MTNRITSELQLLLDDLHRSGGWLLICGDTVRIVGLGEARRALLQSRGGAVTGMDLYQLAGIFGNLVGDRNCFTSSEAATAGGVSTS